MGDARGWSCQWCVSMHERTCRAGLFVSRSTKMPCVQRRAGEGLQGGVRGCIVLEEVITCMYLFAGLSDR